MKTLKEIQELHKELTLNDSGLTDIKDICIDTGWIECLEWILQGGK